MRCGILWCHCAIPPHFLFLWLWVIYNVICNNSILGGWMLWICANSFFLPLLFSCNRNLSPRKSYFHKKNPTQPKKNPASQRLSCFIPVPPHFHDSNVNLWNRDALFSIHTVSIYPRCLLFGWKKKSANYASKRRERRVKQILPK